jgi:hypothetical protein
MGLTILILSVLSYAVPCASACFVVWTIMRYHSIPKILEARKNLVLAEEKSRARTEKALQLMSGGHSCTQWCDPQEGVHDTRWDGKT